MEKKKERMMMPREQLKLGTTLNGKDSMIACIEETFGLECVDGVMDFSQCKELVDLLCGDASTEK